MVNQRNGGTHELSTESITLIKQLAPLLVRLVALLPQPIHLSLQFVKLVADLLRLGVVKELTQLINLCLRGGDIVVRRA